MRILIAHSFYRNPGGEDGYVRRQSELLSESHDVSLIAEQNTELGAGVRTSAAMGYSRTKISDIESTIKEFAPDVVHVHNIYPALGPAVHLAAEKLSIPLVMTIHNFRLRCPNGYMFTNGEVCERCLGGRYFNAVIHPCFPTKKQAAAYATILWGHRFLIRLEDKVRIFVAPSLFMRDQLLKWGISAERIATIPHFVKQQSQAPSELGSYGVYVGRLSSEKGIDILLKSLASAGDPAFRIIGDGPLGPELRGYAQQLELRNTRFMGHLQPSEVSQILVGARFLVMPSLSHENAPLAALEAMAAGRPLLVTSRGGLPELVAGGAGLICEAGDVADMSSKLRALMEDEDLCLKAADVAFADAQNRFGPDKHRESLLAAYASALDS